MQLMAVSLVQPLTLIEAHKIEETFVYCKKKYITKNVNRLAMYILVASYYSARNT